MLFPFLFLLLNLLYKSFICSFFCISCLSFLCKSFFFLIIGEVKKFVRLWLRFSRGTISPMTLTGRSPLTFDAYEVTMNFPDLSKSSCIHDLELFDKEGWHLRGGGEKGGSVFRFFWVFFQCEPHAGAHDNGKAASDSFR